MVSIDFAFSDNKDDVDNELEDESERIDDDVDVWFGDKDRDLGLYDE